MSEFWDQSYGKPGFKYGTEPNAFLRAHEPHLRRGGRVLVPGDGEGRNGVWLAQQGHRVTAVDSSRVAIEKAEALARERGVVVERVLADLEAWVPTGTYDAVVLCYVHFAPPLRTVLHRRFAACLAPGGMLVFEAFHPRHLGRSPFGPKDIAMLCDLAALRSDFAAVLDEVLGEEVDIVLAEGPGHDGPALVTRGVWQRR
jgi:SAM-dependent methyltransferase